MLDYNKIIVIGCCGSGKSTFSKQLADMTGLPLYHLDNIYWLPDTSHLERPEFIRRQKEIMQGEHWIIDGNYGGTMEYRIKECELAYFFDMPTQVCLEGVMKRDKSRADIACELEPDKELLDYIKNYQKESKPRVRQLFKRYPDVKVITFKSHREADDYISDLKRKR